MRVASSLALGLAALALLALVGQTQAAPERSILVLPVTSHWVTAPLAEAVANALPDALAQAGFRPADMTPGAPAYERGLAEGWLAAEDLEAERLQSTRHRLAVAAGTDASLTGEVSEIHSGINLRADLAGSISRRSVCLEVAVPLADDKSLVARELSDRLALALTDEVWMDAGADEESARLAAEERYMAGCQALSLSMYREATIEFEAALRGEPANVDYLYAAAEAFAGDGAPVRALALLRQANGIWPDDPNLLVRLGDVALLAGEPEEAEAAFMSAQRVDPADLRALEGVARAARARGDLARSEEHYARLLGLLGLSGPGPGPDEPGLAPTPPADTDGLLPGLLARESADSIRLTDVPGDALGLPLGRLYLRARHYQKGVAALLAYEATAPRPPYADLDYLGLAAALDEESEQVARGAALLTAAPPDELGNDETDAEIDALHARSERLATLSERMEVSSLLDPAHRYRVLAYNLLNQSNFEALMYFRTHDDDRQRRADLLRDASRKARTQAQQLGEGLRATPAMPFAASLGGDR